jgi:uncharacterized protein YkwD
MSRIIIVLLGFLLVTRAPGQNQHEKPAKAATVTNVSLRQAPSRAASFAFGSEAEGHLFDLANQARLEAGRPPLQADEGLTQAARAHAAAMATQQQLSHQLSGEPALPQRLAADTKLHLDVAGENVAFAGTVEQAADGLMHSPQHRENLLSPDFNVAGFAVVQSGSKLYVVQDFAHSMPMLPASQAENAIAEGIRRMRAGAKLPELRQTNGADAQSIACAMAHADSLKTPSPQRRYIMRYTAMQPDNFPSGVSKIISDPSVNAFTSGTCYAKTASYPNGAFWVALIFY